MFLGTFNLARDEFSGFHMYNLFIAATRCYLAKQFPVFRRTLLATWDEFIYGRVKRVQKHSLEKKSSGSGKLTQMKLL